MPTYFNPLIVPQGREDSTTSGRQAEPVATVICALDPAPRVVINIGVTIVSYDRADKRVV